MEKNQEINKLLAEYKHLINFEDSMERNNYKFATGYLGWAQRKYEDFEKESIAFLSDLIQVHKMYLTHKQYYKNRGTQ